MSRIKVQSDLRALTPSEGLMGPAWSAVESGWLLLLGQVRCSMKITLARKSGSEPQFCGLFSKCPWASHFSLGLSLLVWKQRNSTKGFLPHFSSAHQIPLSFLTAHGHCRPFAIPLCPSPTPGSWQGLASREAALLRANPLWVSTRGAEVGAQPP